MDQTITLRRLGPDDLDILLDIPVGLFDFSVDATQAKAFLADPLHVLVLAFDGSFAVAMASGNVMLHPDKPPAFFINEVGVREAYRRRGIGRAVTEKIMQIARERGCKGIWLGTENDNAPAIALYRSLAGAEFPGVYFGWDGAFDLD